MVDHCNATEQARNLAPPVVEDKLSALQAEYDEFAYIVSHDLQAPLRHIREFSRLLLRSFGKDLTPTQEEYAAFLDRGVRKSEAMIAALLEYSRVQTRTLPMTPVPVGKIVAEAMHELQGRIDATSTTVTFNDLPTVAADKTQLRRLFVHVLGNAISFRQPGTPPEITIAATETPLFYTFSIADNGVGLPVEYQEQALKLFKTVGGPVADLEQETLGAGLAVVQKIVHRHGGTIWFEQQDASPEGAPPEKTNMNTNTGTKLCFSILRREQPSL